MKQVKAKLVSKPEKLLGELERSHSPSVRLPPYPRDTFGTWLVWIRWPEISIQAKPGQFVLVNCGDLYLPRPISIHRVENNTFALLFSELEGSKGIAWLSKRKRGNEIEIVGAKPLGNGFSIPPKAKKLLLVAGGIGIAPLVFLADYAIAQKRQVVLIHGASGEHKTLGQPNPEQVYPKSLLSPKVTFDPIVTSSNGKLNMATDLIPKYIDWADEVFACGPLAMYKDLARRKKKLLKDKPCQISLEMRMACGHGVCYGCTIETKQGLKQVCKDGPVFNLDDVETILKDDALCAKWLTV